MVSNLGMALMAFFAQLFLSKVAFMSGAALLLAKIALLFSTLVTEIAIRLLRITSFSTNTFYA